MEFGRNIPDLNPCGQKKRVLSAVYHVNNDQYLYQTSLSASLVLMARQVHLYEARTHLSRLVDEAGGETIVIAKGTVIPTD